jgi:hypothetical protein
MKKILPIILIIAVFAFSCKREGPPGPNGDELLAKVYDVTVDLTSQNNYSVIFDCTHQLFTSDMFLVYFSWDTDQRRYMALVTSGSAFPGGNTSVQF